MIDYSEIDSYFSNKKIERLEKVFDIFLWQRSFSGNEMTLLAEFESFSILPEDEKSTAWDKLLRKVQDERNLPVLAYGLAGDISISRFAWLLEQVKSSINAYTDIPYSLVTIAATFGQVERLDALIKAGYQPSSEELKNGFFYAIYFGHQPMVEFIFSKLGTSLSTLKDTADNTPLHVAVMGQQLEMADYVARQDTTQMVHANKMGYLPIESAALSGEKLLLDKVINIHQICSVEINYIAILRALAKSTDFSEMHRDLLAQIHEKYHQDTTLMISLIHDAISVGNIHFIQEFLLDVRLTTDLSELNDYAKTQPHQPVIFLLGEENLYREWILNLKINLLSRYEAYVDRKPSQLLSLAEEDGYTTAYPRANVATSTAGKKKTCQSMLDQFFQNRNIQQVLRGKYNSYDNRQADRGNYYKEIMLPRQTLSQAIKNNDYLSLEICLLNAMQLHEDYFRLYQRETRLNESSIYSPRPDDIDTTTDLQDVTTPSDYSLEPRITYTPKVRLFIDTFAEQFDRTYRFYMCLSTGELLKRPDATDQLAEVAKKAAGILPNVSVSAAALGIPLPLSFDFPSSVAVVAVIDLCMYIREQHQQARAKRIERFFAGTTLHDRTEIIYDCAKSMAKQFYDQIEKLDNLQGGVPYFAEIAVVRLFEYMVKCDENVQSSGRSRLLAFFRKLMSTMVDVGPEPEIIHKPLSRVAGDALSIQQHLVFYKNDAEEHPLLLDIEYRDVTRQDPSKQWTSKGIFEHTGIWAEDGHTYCGRNQNVEKYGFIYSTTEDAKRRGMSVCDKVSWVHAASIKSPSTQEGFQPESTHSSKKKSSWINLNFLTRSADTRSQPGEIKSGAQMGASVSSKF